MGSTKLWLPSLRSVDSQRGGLSIVLLGHVLSGRFKGLKGWYFFHGSLSIGILLEIESASCLRLYSGQLTIVLCLQKDEESKGYLACVHGESTLSEYWKDVREERAGRVLVQREV